MKEGRMEGYMKEGLTIRRKEGKKDRRTMEGRTI
jgi:hypothetical protein